MSHQSSQREITPYSSGCLGRARRSTEPMRLHQRQGGGHQVPPRHPLKLWKPLCRERDSWKNKLINIGLRQGSDSDIRFELDLRVVLMSALSKSCKRIDKKRKEDVLRLVALALEPRQRWKKKGRRVKERVASLTVKSHRRLSRIHWECYIM